MNLGWIDWTIIAVYMVGTVVAGLSVRRYVGKVEHFIVAGRHMDIYLGVASLAATEFGLVTVMYTAQLGYTSGFAGSMPGILMAVAMFFVGLTGFCIHRLRKAEVLTIPELFQRRFGLGVRWLAGVVIVLGGLLNMGVFLRLGGQFLINFIGLPETLYFVGYGVPTIPAMMTALLLLVLTYTALGGMLSVLITDYLQFIVLGLGLVLVTCFVFGTVGWTGLVDAVTREHGAGGFNPLINPGQGPIWLTWMAIQQLAVVLTWQTVIARVLSTKSPKAAKMVYTRTSFYFVGRFLIPALWGIGALAVLGPHLIESGNSMDAMPQYLAVLIPVGLTGLVIAAMLAAEMSTDSSYLLTWASVIYNDILGPVRKRPLTDREGLWWNRIIVLAIGLFLLLYGLWYQLPGTAWDYLSITGSIYLSSISVLLVACLYWKKANRTGAYAAIILGATTPLSCVFIPVLVAIPDGHWIKDPAITGLAAYVLAAAGMIVGSLLGGGRQAAAQEAQ